MPTSDVSLAHYQIAARKAFHVIADRIDNTDKFMANCHRHGNCLLRPRIPIINVHVSATDGGLQYPNEHIIALNFWDRNFLEPETGLGFRFYDGFHRFLHAMMLSADCADSRRFSRKPEINDHQPL